MQKIISNLQAQDKSRFGWFPSLLSDRQMSRLGDQSIVNTAKSCISWHPISHWNFSWRQLPTYLFQEYFVTLLPRCSLDLCRCRLLLEHHMCSTQLVVQREATSCKHKRALMQNALHGEVITWGLGGWTKAMQWGIFSWGWRSGMIVENHEKECMIWWEMLKYDMMRWDGMRLKGCDKTKIRWNMMKHAETL